MQSTQRERNGDILTSLVVAIAAAAEKAAHNDFNCPK
jgi:hypothetical protein